MTAFRAIGAWTSPVLVTSLAFLVFQDDASAPLLTVAALVAPLIALLYGSPRQPGDAVSERASPERLIPLPRAVSVPIAMLGIGAIACANFMLIAELARLAGVDRWYALGAALAVALVPALSRDVDAWWPGVVPVGIAACAVPLAAVALMTGTTPWGAWSAIASRQQFAFDERSDWVTEGRKLGTDVVLAFTEAHRVTAVTPGVYRVLERDADRDVVREWRLASGDVVLLRPGDRLVLSRGTRVRFEAGKSVPGVAPSGPAWADPARDRRFTTALRFLGAAVTLSGGAIALMCGARAMTFVSALGASLTLALSVLASLGWGVYAMYRAPDLLIGATVLTPIFDLPTVVDPNRGTALAIAAGIGVIALFTTTMAALARRLEAVAGLEGGSARAAWVVVCVASVAVAAWPADPWRLALTGLGFVASAWVAPALTNARGPAAGIGAAAGAVAFAILAFADVPAMAAVPGVKEFPALVAAPLAWCVAHVADTVAGASRH